MSSSVRFTKMSGAGNDFIVIDARHMQETRASAFAARVCRRRLELGADGLLLVSPAATNEVHVRYWNADGSDAAFCGNGARCAARFAVHEGLTSSELLLHFCGTHRAWVGSDEVTVEVEEPHIFADRIDIEIDGTLFKGTMVDAGVDHLVFFTEGTPAPRLSCLARAVFAAHPRFEGQVNLSLARFVDAKTIALRTFERGSGETLACGSAAIAAGFLLARTRGEQRVRILPPSQQVLFVQVEPPGRRVLLSGEARIVASGEIPA